MYHNCWAGSPKPFYLFLGFQGLTTTAYHSEINEQVDMYKGPLAALGVIAWRRTKGTQTYTSKRSSTPLTRRCSRRQVSPFSAILPWESRSAKNSNGLVGLLTEMYWDAPLMAVQQSSLHRVSMMNTITGQKLDSTQRCYKKYFGKSLKQQPFITVG